MIPKFLMADNSQDNPDRLYIVHTQKPSFIVGFDIEDFNLNQDIEWFDGEPDQEVIADLLVDAEEFLELELSNQEDIFEEE
jgi:hypothetical protein